MDALRSHLEGGEGRQESGFISGVINFLSSSSFGTAAHSQPPWSPARVYRWIASGLKPPSFTVSDQEDEGDMAEAISQTHARLGPVLLLSRYQIRCMIARYGGVVNMSATDAAARVLLLRELLPNCDAVYLLERHPYLFCSTPLPELRAKLVAAVGKLRAGLRGAPLTRVVMSDPEIMFMDLDHGLAELRNLWDVDETALGNSEPHELAFAVRALAATSPNLDPSLRVKGPGLPGSGVPGAYEEGEQARAKSEAAKKWERSPWRGLANNLRSWAADLAEGKLVED
eukprot:CAMPEP_0202860170 /NCGR_PEP_ID=MMETSP1391-20130828/1993_1 /ASSEMBLY_ACC=CAM_ASM_000867 /TAXON_ID=1034604 /ORGANISM="Chlamydomonas leiostraca, Strain SAG 11-49" /LENGTH=284 /DNA_ID=CAMNT_0049539309 /DNA_START=241 /DNA_END=1095 /DNA_ORIENTATION=+